MDLKNRNTILSGKGDKYVMFKLFKKKITLNYSFNNDFIRLLNEIENLYNTNLTNNQKIYLNQLNPVVKRSYDSYKDIVNIVSTAPNDYDFISLQNKVFKGILKGVDEKLIKDFKQYKSIYKK
jgi:hypothetical protein